jgi:hypothetical protein
MKGCNRIRGALLIAPLLLAAACSGEQQTAHQGPYVHWVDIDSKEVDGVAVARRERSVPNGPLLHVIGVYEGTVSASGEATVPVTIEDQHGRKVYLALSSFQDLNWHVQGPGAASVKGILLVGHGQSRVTGLDSANVYNHSGSKAVTEEDTAVGSPYGYPGEKAEAIMLVRQLHRQLLGTGLPHSCRPGGCAPFDFRAIAANPLVS